MKCPAFARLIDHVDGKLSPAAAASVSDHIANGCLECAQTVDWYKRVRDVAASDELVSPPQWVLKRAVKIFDEQNRTPSLAARLKRAVASLVFDSLAQPAFAGVRSTETTNRQLLYRAGDYTIDVQVALTSTEGRADLIGQVLKEGEETFESVRGLKLSIARRDETVFSGITQQMGEFSVSGLDCGSYDLRVETPDGMIDVNGLTVMDR